MDIREALRKRIGPLADEAYGSLDIIGDVAIVKVPNELTDKSQEVGEAVQDVHKNVKAVYRQTSPVEDTFRTRDLELVAGDRVEVTEHKEYGCRYLVDVFDTYFSPRLGTERHRVANRVREGEEIINMFAGVGPYSILIAKTHPSVRVYSVEVNPRAVELHEKNNSLNKVEDRIEVIRGDSNEVLTTLLRDSGDRIIMPLPESALDYLDAALSGLKSRGWIHVYSHQGFDESEGEAHDKALARAESAVDDSSYAVKEAESRSVREVGPKYLEVCLDLLLKEEA